MTILQLVLLTLTLSVGGFYLALFGMRLDDDLYNDRKFLLGYLLTFAGFCCMALSIVAFIGLIHEIFN